jgi:prepilin-type N-terminal cleavage/methylation domain-containing protein
MTRSHGFTLIELLIVVLIIAILAAIAVPNFLEFQTRAKVSRARSDMRSIATGLEAYIVDWGSYTNDSDERMAGNQNGLTRLTTPISYLSSVFLDAFPGGRDSNQVSGPIWYELASGADQGGWPVSDTKGIIQAWLLISPGPNMDDDTDNQDNWPGAGELWVYDPTNGTVSFGDLYRGGGDYRRGSFEINGEETGFEINN